jgi:hypothetical protein
MRFNIMDHTGHSTLDFDKLDPAALKSAQDKFDELISSGHRAATRDSGGTDYQVVKNFDELKDESLFVPQMKGG